MLARTTESSNAYAQARSHEGSVAHSPAYPGAPSAHPTPGDSGVGLRDGWAETILAQTIEYLLSTNHDPLPLFIPAGGRVWTIDTSTLTNEPVSESAEIQT